MALESRHLIQLETGQGKTALCLAIGAFFINDCQKVFIMNQSEDLTFRDFKKAEKCSAALKIDVVFLEDFPDSSVIHDGIIYLSYGTFVKVHASIEQWDFQKMKLIFDEFDSVAFSRTVDQKQLRSLIMLFSSVVAFTGSSLQDFHSKHIET